MEKGEWRVAVEPFSAPQAREKARDLIDQVQRVWEGFALTPPFTDQLIN